MQPVQVTIRDMPISRFLTNHILTKAEKLDHFYHNIQRCRVMIDVPQKHKRQGKLFRVRIDLFVPGKEIIVNHKLDEDVYVAIRDAFNAALRQLENYARKRRGDVKRHEGLDMGYIKRLFEEEGFGFIQGIDGNEYYFSITNVTYPDFNQLKLGDIVHFITAQAAEGLQAHRVTRNNHSQEI